MVLVASAVFAPAAQATPVNPTECSAESYNKDPRLGPAQLPTAGEVGEQLKGYSRTGNLSEKKFLEEYWVNGGWKWPPANGFVTDPQGKPIKNRFTLTKNRRVDRYGGTGGGFLAPEKSSYASRSIPPQNLNGTPPEKCNYHIYLVLKDFDVDSGTIAKWFAQVGGGTQYQLNGSYVQGAPQKLNVQWLLDNKYLETKR
ncbi:MAG: TNT domain-containing protein [Saccharothrix sp.]|nr:TNT domain-containing protein [Saccharothrix sp.]